MHDPWMERLSEYLDGELGSPDREALEAHVKQCAECARTLEELGRVRAEARGLPRPPAPAELWPRIESAIAKPGTITRLASPRRSRFFSLPELLAACLAVAILSAGGAFLALRHRQPAEMVARVPQVKPEASEERRAEPEASVAAVPAEKTSPEGALAAQAPETPKEEAISELRKALARERDRLDPTTIRTLEANLAIIDLAIDQAKRALAADPADSYVKQHLAETMRRRVELLQRATMLASTSSSEGPR
jgi:putative zinc finger protein